jgi:hypothetical protein
MEDLTQAFKPMNFRLNKVQRHGLKKKLGGSSYSFQPGILRIWPNDACKIPDFSTNSRRNSKKILVFCHDF